MEAALSLILEPAVGVFSAVDMYHWLAEGHPTSVFTRTAEHVPWLPGVYLLEVTPTFPHSELQKELARDEALRVNYREGSCIAVEICPREYRGYVPEDRVVTFQGQEGELKTAIWALRGLPYVPSLEETAGEQLLKLLHAEHRITLTVLKKGEGAPSSVSYVQEWQCWAFSCKHDSLLARDLSHTRPEGRWKTVSKFADFWLTHCQALSPERLAALQSALTARTLVGEFSTDHVLILPPQHGFKWYALVAKEDQGLCLPTAHSRSLFAQFEFLTHLERMRECGPDQLLAVLNEVASEASRSAMVDAGRETLILFEANGTVLAANQIKNFEFSLYLRLFDSLALALRKEVPLTVPMLKLIREAAQLTGKGLLPAPADFYESLIRNAFETVEAKAELFHSDFHQFLQDSQSAEIVNAPVEPSGALAVVLITPPLYFTASELKHLQQVLNIPHPLAWEWRESLRDRPAGVTLYCLHLIPRISDTFDKTAVLVFAGFSEEGRTISAKRLVEAKRSAAECPGVFSFIRSEDCDSKLNRLIAQGLTESEHLRQRLPEHVLIFPTISVEELVPQILPRTAEIPGPVPRNPPTQRPVKKRLLCLLVPLGIPGMGKSTLIPRLREAAAAVDCELEVISSDAIREQCMRTFMQKNKMFDADSAFERTAKTSKELFFKQLRQAVNSGRQRLIIYLDKNHPPNAIPSLMAETQQFPGIRVAVVPLCGTVTPPHFQLSATFLAQCLRRVLTRQTHETLTSAPFKRVSVAMMMFEMFRDFSFGDLLSQGFSAIMRIPFTCENIELPQELGSMLFNLAVGVAPKAQLSAHAAKKLAELIEQWADAIPEVDCSEALFSEIKRVCA